MLQPASAEVLEQFRDGFECWNRDEFDAMRDMYAEDAVFDVSAVFTDIAPVQGHKAMRRYWDELRETWAGLRIEPLAAFDAGDGRFAVDLRMWGTGQRSGAAVDQRFGGLYTLRPEDGKVLKMQLLPDVAAAISAAEATAPHTA